MCVPFRPNRALLMQPANNRNRIRHLHTVKRRLTDGCVHKLYYHRLTRARLPEPSDPNFLTRYEEENRIATAAKDRATDKLTEGPAIAPEASEVELVDDVLLTPEELHERWRRRVSLGTFRNWRSARQGVSFVRIGREVFYPLTAVEEFEAKNTVRCDDQSVVIESEDE